jgi:hypothetical protein
MRHPSQDSDLVPCTETYSRQDTTKLTQSSSDQITACAPPLHARGAPEAVPNASGATLCCDCRAPMSPLEVTLYRWQCRRCAGNS